MNKETDDCKKRTLDIEKSDMPQSSNNTKCNLKLPNCMSEKEVPRAFVLQEDMNLKDFCQRYQIIPGKNQFRKEKYMEVH